MIRVLVVDDSPTVRALLCSVLESDGEIRVVGEAGDGEEAVEMAVRERPDLITMDVHMPRVDGLEATKRIMVRAPTPIVIVSASTQVRDVGRAFDAMQAGAVALLPKPIDPSAADFERAAQELVTTVKDLANLKVVRRWGKKEPRPAAEPTLLGRRLVGIAASTGGPGALQRILGELRRDFPAPVLVVQHIAAGFSRGMVEWLQGRSALRLKIGEDGEEVQPGVVYFAPDGVHLGIGPHGRLDLTASPPISGHRPSATHMFRAIARYAGSEAVGVVLTGMGRDGVDGLAELKSSGGTVLGQDRDTSVVYGMNGEAMAMGLTDEELPLGVIATRLTHIVESRHA